MAVCIECELEHHAPLFAPVTNPSDDELSCQLCQCEDCTSE
jgi:hypothetical protein